MRSLPRFTTKSPSKCLRFSFHASIRFPERHDTNVNIAAAHTQLVVGDVFHDMSRILLTKSKPDVVQTKVLLIVFPQGIDVFLALDSISFMSTDEQLGYVVREFLLYYNHERPHSGLGGRMTAPRPQDEDGETVMFSRPGGLLES